MNNVPKVLEEPLLRSPSWFYQDIPLVPLKVFAFSAINPRVEVKGITLILCGHTKYPRRVHRSRYVPNRRNLPVPPQEDVREYCHTSRKCAELILHG